MTRVLWEPDTRKPADWGVLEGEIQRVAPGAEVKLTLVEGTWLVRALAPAAMCSRGHDAPSRDVSLAVAEALAELDCPARARGR